MSTDSLPALIERLERNADQARLALAAVTADLAAVRALRPVPTAATEFGLGHLPAPSAGAVPVPAPAPDGHPGQAVRPGPMPAPVPGYGSLPSPNRPGHTVPGASTATPPMAPAPTPIAPQPVPWLRREGMISRLVAFIGAGILLIGVALLLVLAAQSGYFGPVPRTVGAACLAVALVGAGLAVRRRWPDNVGAIALVASGLAAAYLDVAAASALYGWLPRVPALAVAGGLAVGGVLLGRRWRSEALAVISLGGALLLVPWVSPSPTASLAFLVVLTVAGTALVARPWLVLQVVRTLPTALYAALVAIEVSLGGPDLGLVVAATIVLGAVGLVGCGLTAGAAVARGPRIMAASLLPVLVLPALIVGVRLERPEGIALLAGSAAVLLAAAFVRRLGTAARGAAGAAGTLALGLGLVRLVDGASPATVALGIAVATLIVGRQTRDLVTSVRGAAFAAIGALVWLPGAAQALLGGSHASGATAEQILAGTLVAAAASLCAEELRRRLGRRSTAMGYALLALALVALSSVIVTAGEVLGASVGMGLEGFRAGHAVATVGLICLAGALLLVGVGRPDGASMQRFGGALAAAVVAKLFLFDLAALSGLARVLSFIVAGLVLITLGVLYARTLERAKARTEAQDAAPTASAAEPLVSPVDVE